MSTSGYVVIALIAATVTALISDRMSEIVATLALFAWLALYVAYTFGYV